MTGPANVWRPDAYPAPVPARELAQVTHAGRTIFVVERELDAGAAMLAVYDRHGRYQRRHVLAVELNVERIDLHDGPALQSVVPGVQPVSHAARQIAQERQRRTLRRGASPLPSGGLFDEAARQQQELF